MTIDERVDALSEEAARDTLRKVVAFAEAYGAPRPLAKILRGWSLLGEGERRAEVRMEGGEAACMPVDDYDTEATVVGATRSLKPGARVESVKFTRQVEPARPQHGAIE